MSSSSPSLSLSLSLSLTKAKEIAINFIKKYKDSLRDSDTCKLITDEDIERYASKKVAKKPEVVTISDTTEVQNEIAFIDFEADKFEHALKTGGDNFVPWIDNASENSELNQIDHAINAFKLAKKELDVFLTELVKAKDAGAKYVVDTSCCKREDFSF